ncbi:MAG: polysaccharide deacetylase family protein, partial [Lysobacter sp.]
MKHLPARVVVVSLLTLGLLACKREAPAPVAPPPATAVTTTAAPTSVAPLADVIETTPDYVIGISYPPSAAKYPGLATELQRYANAARGELLEAVKARQAVADGASPYDLSISFTEVLDSPTLFAVAADGSSYTGGAHGAPLIARFVWLPQQDRLLTANDLVPDARSWTPIAANVREQLLTALSQRVDADALPPAERLEVV